MAVAYLLSLAVKAVANIQPRQYQKTELNWSNNYEPETRYATKKELDKAGIVPVYIDGQRFFCKYEGENLEDCSYWD